MSFLRNAWYVAAWAEELKPGAMLHRRLLDEPVLMFRDSNDRVQALSDRCPHRFAPLHLGTLNGDTIQCRYHGLMFNGRGECVHNPHGEIPRAARVHSYPLVERYSMLWIWMGDSVRADASLIPDFSFQDPELFFVGKRYLAVQSSYLLEIENIMDLSHIQFLHPTTLGSGDVAKGRYESTQEGGFVWSKRLTDGEVMVDHLCDAMGVPRGVPIDRWMEVRWSAPANMVIFAGAVPSGRPRSDGRDTPTSHCFTPATANTTHYWFSISFPKSMGKDAARMAEEQIEWLKMPFETEDLPMLEAQNRNMQGLESFRPILLAGDAAGVRARRVLDQLINEEQVTMAASKNSTVVTAG